MKTILYATDFSENAKNALQYAYELSIKSGAELIMFHVFDIPTFFNTPSKSSTFIDVEKDTERITKIKLQNLFETYFGIDVRTQQVRFEAKQNISPVSGIIEMVNESNADLVVMGSKGVSRLRELIMGSTAKGVIEKAECPVLTIPMEANYKTPKHIFYATDFEAADIEAINALSKIAELFTAKVTVAHVSTEHEYSGKKLMENFKELLQKKVTYKRLKFELLVSNNIYEQLNNYVVTNDISMIVLLERRNENVFDKWFHRDVVERVESSINIPLMSFNKKYLTHFMEKKEEQLLMK